jgi:hypothetical protein|nr:hypothetical protein A152_15880 [Vibrio tasmaniensis 1F-187]
MEQKRFIMGKVSEEKIEQALALFISEDRKINANAIARYLGCQRSNIANNYPKLLAKIDTARQVQKKQWDNRDLSYKNKKLTEQNKKQQKAISQLSKSAKGDDVSALLSHINALYSMYDDMRVRYENASELLLEYKEKYGKL